MKKGIILLFTLGVVLTPFSCEDFKLSVDCNKCYTSLSDKYNVEIKVTLGNENWFVPITFYRGKIDNGEIIAEDTIYSLPYYSDLVDFGGYYSAVAKYTHKGRVIFVVDGKKLSKKT